MRTMSKGRYLRPFGLAGKRSAVSAQDSDKGAFVWFAAYYRAEGLFHG